MSGGRRRSFRFLLFHPEAVVQDPCKPPSVGPLGLIVPEVRRQEAERCHQDPLRPLLTYRPPAPALPERPLARSPLTMSVSRTHCGRPLDRFSSRLTVGSPRSPDTIGRLSSSPRRYAQVKAASQQANVLSLPSDQRIQAAIVGVAADIPATNNRVISFCN
jgi:hypothetical protein